MPSPNQAEHDPIETYLDYLDVECGLAQNTLDAYRRDLGCLVGYVGERVQADLLTVHRDDLREFLASRHADGSSVESIRRLISSLRGFYRFLCTDGQLSRNPAEDLTLPKAWERLPKVLSIEEVERLMSSVEPSVTPTPVRDRAILELLYGCGLRVSELCGLRTGDLRLDDGFLRCRGKGSKERLVPVGGAARVALAEYLREERPSSEKSGDVALLSVRGLPLGRETVFRILRKFGGLAGLPKPISPHTLRHSYATHLLRGGAGLREVQELLGHADIRTTEIYTHVDRQELKELHRKHHPRG